MDIDDISEYIQEGIEKLDSKAQHHVDTEQPIHASWLSVDVDMRNDYSVDHTTFIDYEDEYRLQAKLIEAITAIASPQILQQIRNGTIEHLTFRIGPRALSGTDMNEEMGISELVFSK